MDATLMMNHLSMEGFIALLLLGVIAILVVRRLDR